MAILLQKTTLLIGYLKLMEKEGDNGYSEFYKTVDTIFIGKRTYDWIMEQEEGKFPYENKDCYVFSRQSLENTKDVTFINEDIVSFTNKLKKEDGKSIWIVGGGDILHTFIKEKLIDELILIVAPMIIGEGIPLFKEGGHELDLSLVGSRRFNQFVELHYKVK